MNRYETRRYVRHGEDSQAIWIPARNGAHSSDSLSPTLALPPAPSMSKHRMPDRIFVRGRPEAFERLRELPGRGLAVVGTRKPQGRTLRFLRELLESLRDQRLVVISGLALGVDSAAHEAALDVGLPTIAILGGPLEEIYPPQNRELAARILANGGLLVSEYPAGDRIQPHYFLMRNRLIATWSKATWIAEAGMRSGALNTAQWAHDNDREVYATPSFPGDPAFDGCQTLLGRFDDHGSPKARPLQHPLSLSFTWPELQAPALRTTQLSFGLTSTQYNEVTQDSDTEQLKKEVARSTQQNGGATVESLLDWALSRKWDPPRFFETLRLGVDSKELGERDGVLHWPPVKDGQT